MKQQEQFARLAWHGIAVDVPEEWCPASLEGTFDSGYLRVEDETQVRLELRWESPGRTPPPAADLVDGYLKQARKKLPRGSPEPAVDRGRSVPGLGHLDHEAFTWRGGFNAHSLLVVAPEPRRVVHVRVFFSDEEKHHRSLARRIFASLRLGPRDGQYEWAAFGLRFGVPQDCRLERSSLRTGCLQFVFQAGGGDQLEVVRQSLAEITLRKATLEQWLRGVFAKPLRSFRCAPLGDGAYRGHEAVRLAGEVSLRARPLAVLRRRRHATVLGWHCPQADKLFAIRCESAVPGDPRVAACAGSITCH